MKQRITLLSYLVFLFFSLNASAQMNLALPHSTPDAEGVSSEKIIQFLDAVQKSKHELHSMMFLRHGKVIAEAWNSPYRADLKHSLYSCSKSFTSTAIGFAVSENKLTVNDRVVTFFPDDLPEKISPYLAELKIKDLLSMSVGQSVETTWPTISQETDWVKSFLSTPIPIKPGTKFLYNSFATYMLSAIVQKVTGQKVIDYLQPRLFAPLGISGVDWEVDPKGINVGGWGLRVKTEDMAKFAQFYLQKGKWNGAQILPAAWIEEATTKKIDNAAINLNQTQRDASDWAQGYCYQFWRSKNNAYRGDGAYGQYMIVMPEQDAVVVITSETPDLQGEINLVWDYLLPAIGKKSSQLSDDSLKMMSKNLIIPLPVKISDAPMAQQISGKTFTLSPNEKYIRSMSFNFLKDVCNVIIKTDTSSYDLQFGNGNRILSETLRHGPNLVYKAKAHFAGLPATLTAGNYTWTNDSTLELYLRYIESPHTEVFKCKFVGDKLSLDVQNSQENGYTNQKWSGVVAASPPQPIRLIMRGDDMGFSHSGDEALIKSYKEGIETSIEVLIPSPWFPEAVKFLKENPTIDVGVHLALTSEWDNVKWRPMTNAPSLTDSDGYFYPKIFPDKNYPSQSLSENKWKIEEVEKELRAQIEMAIKKIPRVSHISAHMGCTNLSPTVKALEKKLAKEYKIDIDLSDLKVEGLGYDASGKWIGPNLSGNEKVSSFINALKKLQHGKTYLFVDHPGLNTPELQAIHHIGYENVASDRQGVTDLFTNEEVRRFIRLNGIKLVSYKNLVSEKK